MANVFPLKRDWATSLEREYYAKMSEEDMEWRTEDTNKCLALSTEGIRKIEAQVRMYNDIGLASCYMHAACAGTAMGLSECIRWVYSIGERYPDTPIGRAYTRYKHPEEFLHTAEMYMPLLTDGDGEYEQG